ncbi:DUF4326 domain-containing protein [Pseudoclavibacter sp. AY1H1]|uniref:DUF4326 domain-containing protein n=1 Tax=Pseudoclavibacter sp. AY1H1 TaxID=2080584 RepID=UPI0011B0A1BB|nr:DUF4326 domain-containing protein [Pseudoclavibacter sp. AY1H1]
MSEPKRIQRKRTKGWRMPEGAVYVGRGSRWGNPFRIAEHGRERAIQWFANWLSNTVDEQGRYCDGRTDYEGAESSTRPTVAEIRLELAGKDLACWCPLGQLCHADVLLRIANRSTQ